CPPLSTDDKIDRSDEASRARRRNLPVHSSTESTPSKIPGFHAGSSRPARISRALYADKRDLDTEIAALVRLAGDVSSSAQRGTVVTTTGDLWRYGTMDGSSRKPLAKVEGRRRLRLSGVTVAYRGTPNLDDWVAYIVNGTRSKKLILADHSSERKVKSLLSRLQTLPKKDIEKLAKS